MMTFQEHRGLYQHEDENLSPNSLRLCNEDYMW